MYALENNMSIDIIQLLISTENINDKNIHGQTPLIVAVKNNMSIYIIKLSIDILFLTATINDEQ